MGEKGKGREKGKEREYGKIEVGRESDRDTQRKEDI